MTSVLLIKKPTNLEQHGELTRKHWGENSEHLRELESAHDEHYRCLELLRSELRNHSVDFTEIDRGESQPSENFRLVITVGGDGTLLKASHYLDSNPLPMLGIRSSKASVGYLCAGDIRHVPKLVEALSKQELKYSLRQRLKARIQRSGEESVFLTFPVLNDLLYANANPASTTRYRICFQGRCENQKSSGIWFSTATGSTAAISAAGGVSLAGEDMRFQFAVRELYQAHVSLEGGRPHEIQKSFFDPDNDELVIENLSSKAILALDGERGLIRLGFGDKIFLEKAFPLKLVAPIDRG